MTRHVITNNLSMNAYRDIQWVCASVRHPPPVYKGLSQRSGPQLEVLFTYMHIPASCSMWLAKFSVLVATLVNFAGESGVFWGLA